MARASAKRWAFEATTVWGFGVLGFGVLGQSVLELHVQGVRGLGVLGSYGEEYMVQGLRGDCLRVLGAVAGLCLRTAASGISGSNIGFESMLIL